ncbi:MAG: histone deacetylase family protein [Pseudomonadota bacterium]
MPAGAALLLDPVYKRHWTGSAHPERPERYDAIAMALERSGLAQTLLRIQPRAARGDEIALCHTRLYIELARREIESGATELTTGDTTVCEATLEIAQLAAGGVLNAVDAVFSGVARNAFCAVRPPGHHATSDRGMGFCVFNNVALAARYAQQKYGAARVLIADWDVHHGNGTQDIFYRDGTVLYFSTHQSPWYPGTGHPSETGEGPGEGATLNCPFPAGAGRAEILGAFEERLRRAAAKFRPDFVLISAGFDSRLDDPLGRFTLDDQDFADLTRLLLEVAGQYAGGRLVSVLEGGYALSGLGSAVAAHVKALAAPYTESGNVLPPRR